MSASDLNERCYAHTLGCIKLAAEIPKSTLGRIVKNQLIRCATSVSANYRAAKHAQTKAGFVSKLSIVVEESDETEFRLGLIVDTGLLANERVDVIRKEANELSSIFVASRRTAQGRGK